jgi:hypothetical protein
VSGAEGDMGNYTVRRYTCPAGLRGAYFFEVTAAVVVVAG